MESVLVPRTISANVYSSVVLIVVHNPWFCCWFTRAWPCCRLSIDNKKKT